MGNVTVDLAGAAGVSIRDVTVATRGGRQPQVVLALLVLTRNRSLSREELADALWPTARPPTWPAALRLVVSRVRKLLARGGLDPNLLTASDDGYRLGLPNGTVVDVEAAEASVAEAKTLLPHNPTRAMRLAAAAAEIASRPLLPGAEGTWVDRRRAAWLALRVEALEVVSDAALASGKTDASVRAAEDAITIDPLRESAHRRLMTTLAATGNRAEALRAYEACRRILRTDVDAAPSAETEAVYLSLLGTPTPTASTATAAAIAIDAQHPLDLPAPLASRAAEPIVGRDVLLATLKMRWDRTARGHGGAVVLTGEAGIGKTIVAAAIARNAADEGALVLYGGCTEVGTRPYQPIAESVAGFAATLPPDRVMGRLGPMAADVIRLDPTLAVTTSVDSSIVPLGPDHAAARLRDAIVGWLAAEAQRAPVLLVLDDLHWADPPTLQLVGALARAAANASVLVLATQRDGDGRVVPDFENHALPGLPLEAIVELLPDTLRGQPAVAAEILARTDGNPYFAVELGRHLVEGHHGLPDTIREVVTERAGRLPGEGAAVLARAAVLGHEFDDETVSNMAPGCEVAEALAVAAAKRLIRPLPHRPGHYAFAHSCVREALLDGLSPARRVRLHRRAGEIIERHVSRANRAPELAHHFTAAIPVTGADKAVRYCMLAGGQARTAGAFEPAARFYEQAAAALGQESHPDLELRCDILLAWGTALHRCADRRHRHVLREAAEAARKLDDPRRLGQIVLILTTTGGPAGPAADEEIVALANEALESLQDDDPELSARLGAAAAVAMCWDDDVERRERFARQALHQARSLGDPDLLASVLVSSHLARSLPEHLTARTATAHELRELGERHDLPEARWWGSVLGADDLITAGKPVAAIQLLQDAERLARELRQPHFVTGCLLRRVGLAMIAGPLDRPELAMGQPITDAWGPVPPDVLLALHFQRSWLSMEQGREDAPPLGVDATRALGLLTEGRPDEARPYFERRADDFLAGRAWGISRLVELVTVARCAALLGDRLRAGGLYRLLAPFSRRMSWAISFSAGPTDLALGMLAAVMDEVPAAVEHFADSEALCQRFDSRVWLAHTWFEWAKAIGETDPAAADSLARNAQSVADDNGQLPLSGAAAAFAGRLADRSPVR